MIVYHGLPSGLNEHDTEKVFQGRHVLVSYAAPSPLEQAKRWAASILLDNGAFTTWKRGEVFRVDDCIAWMLDAFKIANVTAGLIPDVIDGDETDNDALLLDWPDEYRAYGIPVWHLHESVKRLRDLCHEWHTVAIGSSGEFASPGTASWWRRMAQVWPIIPPHAKIHGLRMLAPDIVSRCPFASADSSTASRHAGFQSKFKQAPLSKCRKSTLVQAYCEHLEATPAAVKFNPPESTNQMRLFA